MQVSTLILCLLVFVGRFFIEPRLDLPTITGSYEAIAHILIGWLLGLWVTTRKAFYLNWFIALTILEVIMFLVQKRMG